MIKNIDDWDNGYDVGFEDGFKEGFEKAIKQKSKKKPENKCINLSIYDKVITNKSMNITVELKFIDDYTLEITATPIDKSKIDKRIDFDLTCKYTALHSIEIDSYLRKCKIYIINVADILENTLYRKRILYNVSNKKPNKYFYVDYDLNL